MLDIKFLRQNPDVVKENIKKKFQDEKLPLVDEVIELDKRNREIKGEVEALRAEKNKVSKEIGACMAHGEKEKAEELKKKVQENATRMEELSAEEKEVEEKCTKIDVLSDEIESNLKQCLELKDKRQCPSCFAEIEKDVKFCPKCGTKQEKIKEEPAKEVEIIENSDSNENEQTESEEKSNLEKTVTVEADPKLDDDKTVEHVSEEE